MVQFLDSSFKVLLKLISELNDYWYWTIKGFALDFYIYIKILFRLFPGTLYIG